jgi:Arc/MetJ-type ribon-helix-helix transcriptional regulator
MNRKKTKARSRSSRLWMEDDDSLQRKVASGEYVDVSDAIRELVSKYLTMERIRSFSSDQRYDAVKSSQKEVIAPLVKEVEIVKKDTTFIVDELAEIRKTLRLFAEINIPSSKLNNESQSENNEITEKLNRLLAMAEINKSGNENIQLQLFMVHGILTFISLGYQSGFLKPTTQMKAKEFIVLLNTATAELSLDTKNNIANNNYDPLESKLAEKVARSIFNALHPPPAKTS